VGWTGRSLAAELARRSVPMLKESRQWVDRPGGQTPPQGLLGKAFGCAVLGDRHGEGERK